MLIFKGEYPTALPGLGVFQPGQEIDDPEKAGRIATSEYKHLFTEVKPQTKKQKKEGDDDQWQAH